VETRSSDSFTEAVDEILDMVDFYNRLDVAKNGRPGQFVVTGPQMGKDRGGRESRIGYCVQVRIKCGQYGSDMVFLRHTNGNLTTHENQSFYAMNEEQEALARGIFEVLPEEEDYSEGFSVNGIRETGFVVENSATAPSPVTPVSVVLTEKLADGTERKTVTTFI
jgi:hypothetical protein